MEKEMRKLLSNSFYLFLDWMVLTTIGFFYWLIAGKLLLPSEYGIVSTSFNLALFVSSVTLLGLQIATWKLISEYIVRKKEKKVGSLIRFSIKVIIVTNLITLGLFLLLSKQLSILLNLPEDAIFVTSLIVVTNSFAVFFGRVMYGFQNMKKYFFTNTWAQLVKIITATVLIFLGFSYMGPLYGLFLSFLVLVILRLRYIPLKLGEDRINYKEVFWVYAFPAFITGIVGLIFMNGQYILLNALRGSEETGYYTIAMLLTNPIVTVPRTLNLALLPISSQLYVQKSKRKRQGKLIEMVFRYSLTVSLPLSLFLIIFSKQVIILFSRPEYVAVSTFFHIVAIASVIYALGGLFLNNLYAIGRTKLNRNIVVATTLLFFTISLPLTALIGVKGLATSYLLSALFLLLTSFYFLRKFLEVKIRWDDIFKISLASLISSSIVYLIAIHTTGLIMNIIACGIGGTVYIISLLFLKFLRKEDRKLIEIIFKKFNLNSKFISGILNF